MPFQTPLPPLTRRPLSAGPPPASTSHYSPRGGGGGGSSSACIGGGSRRFLQPADLRHAPTSKALLAEADALREERERERAVAGGNTKAASSSGGGRVPHPPSPPPLTCTASSSHRLASFEALCASLVAEYGAIGYAPLGSIVAAYEACSNTGSASGNGVGNGGGGERRATVGRPSTAASVSSAASAAAARHASNIRQGRAQAIGEEAAALAETAGNVLSHIEVRAIAAAEEAAERCRGRRATGSAPTPRPPSAATNTKHQQHQSSSIDYLSSPTTAVRPSISARPSTAQAAALTSAKGRTARRVYYTPPPTVYMDKRGLGGGGGGSSSAAASGGGPAAAAGVGGIPPTLSASKRKTLPAHLLSNTTVGLGFGRLLNVSQHSAEAQCARRAMATAAQFPSGSVGHAIAMAASKLLLTRGRGVARGDADDDDETFMTQTHDPRRSAGATAANDCCLYVYPQHGDGDGSSGSTCINGGDASEAVLFLDPYQLMDNVTMRASAAFWSAHSPRGGGGGNSPRSAGGASNNTIVGGIVAGGPARSVLASYIRRPIAGKEMAIKASKDEVLNLRRVLNEVQLHLPALARLQQQKKTNLETEEGQARCLMDIFRIIDEDGSGEIDEEEFVAFGLRIGGETAKVFSRRLFHRIVPPSTAASASSASEVKGIGLDPLLELLFPNFMKARRAQEAMAEDRRREVTTMPKHWQDTFDSRDIEELHRTFCEIDKDGNGSISAEEFALYCEGPSALVAPRNGGPAPLRRYEEHVKRFDVNGDGQIDFKEFAEMQKFYLEATRGKSRDGLLGGSEVRATLAGIQPPQWLPYFE